MDSSSSSSVGSLRLKAENSRARLKETIGQFNEALSETSDDIKTTFSPEHLKDEARAYAKKKQANLVRSVRESVTNRPLEALAIGAVVTYPLLGLLRKVPVPLALIGAGLILVRKGNGKNTAAPTSLAEDEDQDRSEEGLGGRLRAGLKEAQGTIASKGAHAAKSLVGMASSAAAGVECKTQDFAATTAQAAKNTGDSLASLVERNPLIVGGVALAVGGFIAASLPASRIEERVLGKGGEVLKDTARKATDEAVQGAKAEASRVVDDISVAARGAGLTPKALDQAVDTVADKVASVADRAVDAALGGKTSKAETGSKRDGDENARF
ncbi:hypothetical protein [Taklimakanibacter deserti]|uniref:hypothetical protein n=1 Tax=Taklimakanibacter deserti TaxID=2267839 RepID=UPI000E65971D